MLKDKIMIYPTKKIVFENVCWKNLEKAIKVQKELFPYEDGTQTLVNSITIKEKPDPVLKERDYWLVRNENNEIIGITGGYSYHNYPDDFWAGWLGVLETHRGKGYFSMIMDSYLQKGVIGGYKNARLDTDAIMNAEACEIYRRWGMFEEHYNRRDDIPPGRYRDIRIFSISLIAGSSVTPWNNKNLFFSSPILYGREEIWCEKIRCKAGTG